MTKQKQSDAITEKMKWRCIGPPRGGRVVAVAGASAAPLPFYFGACAGGIWKTTDGGTYWECVSDGYLNSATIGALAVSESDPNVIYAGTGETTIRVDVSYGDGVYRSTDGGKTWAHVGLEAPRHIGEIRIHPDDSNIVYVAALGHAFGPNPARGVYRSTDGGETGNLSCTKAIKPAPSIFQWIQTTPEFCLPRSGKHIVIAGIWPVAGQTVHYSARLTVVTLG